MKLMSDAFEMSVVAYCPTTVQGSHPNMIAAHSARSCKQPHIIVDQQSLAVLTSRGVDVGCLEDVCGGLLAIIVAAHGFCQVRTLQQPSAGQCCMLHAERYSANCTITAC
jgi:hypothetical protein